MRLRLKKREADDEIEDVFSQAGVEIGELEDDEDDREDDNGGHHPGFRLLATVPGPYVGGSLQTGFTAGAPAPPATALLSDPGTQGPRTFEALRDPFVPPPVYDVPPARSGSGDRREATRPSESREPLRAPSLADLPTPVVGSPEPTLPPQPRTTIVPVPESRVGRAAEPPRQPQPALLKTTPERSPARNWSPAAAFADREAANRLVSSIQQQGYPVEIRQESSSSRPWVVWIAAQPRAGERRR